MHDETKALLRNCCDAKKAELDPASIIPEVQAFHRKLGALTAKLGALRLDYRMVEACETDAGVRGRVYELGSKVTGLIRLVQKAEEETARVLAGLRVYGDLVDRMEAWEAEQEAPAVAAGEAAGLASMTPAAPTRSPRTSNVEARVARGLEAPPEGVAG